MRPKALGLSFQANCLIAGGGAGESIISSADTLTSHDLRSGVVRHVTIDDGFGGFWMLTCCPDPPGLVMRLGTFHPWRPRLGDLGLSTCTLDQRSLAKGAASFRAAWPS